MSNQSINFSEFTKALDIISECTDDYMYILDFQEDHYVITDRAKDVFALRENNFYNATAVFNNLMYPADLPVISKDLEELKAGKKSVHNLEYRWLDHYGNPVWISCRGIVVNEADKPRYLVGRIAELGKQNRIDKVTGLYQSEVLKDKINFVNELGGYSVALMIIGIDNFKGINEWHGIATGDAILERTARFIEESADRHAQVFRLDGDMFAVFSMEADIVNSSGGMKNIYKTVRAKVDAFMEESAYQIFYTISAGSTVFNTQRTDIDTALNQAKFALHRAKLQGKNNYIEYNKDEHEEYIRRLDIQEELRKSVLNNYEGFELYYQPIIKPSDNTLYGAEALLRWNSRKYGFLSPAVIVPILEDSGLIIPLGKWITETAARKCYEWQRIYPAFRMNINLSFVQLLKSDVVRDTIDRVDEVGISHDNIVFEVTESGQLESSDATRGVLDSFSQKNFQLAIDDFGTGYSNLRYIKEMMFGLIKIDRIFIQNIHQSPYNYTLVKQVTDLAHSLNMKVCMEGVETEAELNRVLELGPDCIQGYYYSRPMTAEEFGRKYFAQVC